jgi:hypothetical protein
MRYRLWIGVVVSIVGGCSIQRAEVADEARHNMVGMSAEQVLSCMGVPAQKVAEGNTEVWAYPSGGADISVGSANTYATGTGLYTGYGSTGTYSGSANATTFGSSSTKHRYCVVNIVMSGGTVQAINYTGNTGGLLTQGEQCAYAVQNCASAAAQRPTSSPATAQPTVLTDAQADLQFRKAATLRCIGAAKMGDSPAQLANNCQCAIDQLALLVTPTQKRDLLAGRPFVGTDPTDSPQYAAALRLNCPDAYGYALTAARDAMGGN